MFSFSECKYYDLSISWWERNYDIQRVENDIFSVGNIENNEVPYDPCFPGDGVEKKEREKGTRKHNVILYTIIFTNWSSKGLIG